MNCNFKVDTLLASLKDLQSEKICLEQKLNKCREKRREYEMELERVGAKHMHVSDVRRKMDETLKVALLKVTQTQCQIDSLEEANQRRRDKISAINKTVEEEKAKQQEDVDMFEDKLSDLTEQLMNARSFYNDENLEKEVQSNREKLEDMAKSLTDTSQEVATLTSTLNQLRLQSTSQVHVQPALPEDVCRVVWQMVCEENQSIHSYLDQLQTDLRGIRETSTTATLGSFPV